MLIYASLRPEQPGILALRMVEEPPTTPRPDASFAKACDKLLVTVEEAAERLSLGRTHCYSLVMRGEIGSVKIGRSRRVPVAALREFVENLRALETRPPTSEET